MEADRENPKTEHEKTLYQNTTDEKGAQKKEHYNQYGKKDYQPKERSGNNLTETDTEDQ